MNRYPPILIAELIDTDAIATVVQVLNAEFTLLRIIIILAALDWYNRRTAYRVIL
jgi:hypothetical protein